MRIICTTCRFRSERSRVELNASYSESYSGLDQPAAFWPRQRLAGVPIWPLVNRATVASPRLAADVWTLGQVARYWGSVLSAGDIADSLTSKPARRQPSATTARSFSFWV